MKISMINKILLESKYPIILFCFYEFISRRDFETLYFFIGSFVASTASKVLKRILKQPRPSNEHKKNFGMPSSHATTICFFASYLLEYILIYKDQKGLFDYLIAILILVATFFTNSVRIKYDYHNLLQTSVGCLLGSTIGSLWLINSFNVFEFLRHHFNILPKQKLLSIIRF
eukprot:TRINITY_DN13839_c0_g1_i1.p1 TRINITY_DN13839_c0_g1~~TRINITY_DN13839_c0_g1_i1.p1  ORF type:complete len:172 (-),score=13.83 TRINITY_DN13839_c0_g1_i1:129-644(-)